jgi:5-(carboxyamino)imidazole ribonucleotide synthase
MANVLGGDDGDIYDRYIHVMAADPGVKVHMYGKQVRPGRKIGHVTVTADQITGTRRQLADRARRAASYLRWGKEDGGHDRGRRGVAARPLVGVVMGSDSDWPVMRAAAEALDEFGVAYEADVVSAHRMPRDMIEYGSAAAGRACG